MKTFRQNVNEIFEDKRFEFLTATELGCYYKMKCYCAYNGSMPADRKRLAVLCCTDKQTIIETPEQTCDFFQPKDDDSKKLIHIEIEKEHQRMLDIKNKNIINGKKGAKIRWANHRKKIK